MCFFDRTLRSSAFGRKHPFPPIGYCARLGMEPSRQKRRVIGGFRDPPEPAVLHGEPPTPAPAFCRPPSGVIAVQRLPSAPPFALVLGPSPPSQLAPRIARSWLSAPRMARSWLGVPRISRPWPGAHIVQKCLFSEITVPCESWGPAPGGRDDSGQRAPPPIRGSAPCHPTAGVPWLHFPSLSGF